MRTYKQISYDPERKIQHILIIDESGQIIEERVRSYGRAFLRLDPVVFETITAELTATAHRLAAIIFRHVQHRNNICYIHFSELVAELNASEPTVARVMDELYEADFIRRVRSGQVMLNPTVAIGCDERLRSEMINIYFSLPQKQTRKRGERRNDNRSGTVREADGEEQTDAGRGLHTATHGPEDQVVQANVQADSGRHESEPNDNSEST